MMRTVARAAGRWAPVAAFWLVAGGVAWAGTARAVFRERVHDFGTVEQGEPVAHVFRFINQGDGPLRIEQVQTSCGCTATVVSSDVIQPGASGEIGTLLDTSGWFGDKARTVMVHTNDPKLPVVTLKLQGRVVAEVAALPAQLYLGRVRRGRKVTRAVDIVYDPARGVEVTGVENNHPGISVQVGELNAAGHGGKRLTVTLADDVSPGGVNDRILVRTTSAKVPELAIAVFGSVEGDLVVRPPQVSFGILAAGGTGVRKVLIKNRGNRPVRILRVEPPSANVEARLSTVKQGEEYRLTLRLRGAAAPGPVRGQVRVYTDHPWEKVLTIRLYGMVGDARQANP